jgi:hypothetical protein
MSDRRTKRVTAENKPEINGELPWADIVEDLTLGEVKVLQQKAPLQTAKYDVAADAIARYIVAWNIEGRNADTGEMEALPAPATAGPEIFDCVEPWVITWLFMHMHVVHQGGADLQKKPTPISATPDSKSATA